MLVDSPMSIVIRRINIRKDESASTHTHSVRGSVGDSHVLRRTEGRCCRPLRTEFNLMFQVSLTSLTRWFIATQLSNLADTIT